MNLIGFGNRADHIGRLAFFLSFHVSWLRAFSVGAVIACGCALSRLRFADRAYSVLTKNLFVGSPDSTLQAREEFPSTFRLRFEEQELSIRHTDRPGLRDS